MEVGEQVDHIFITPNQKACSDKRHFFLIMCYVIYLKSYDCKNSSPWVIQFINLLF